MAANPNRYVTLCAQCGERHDRRMVCRWNIEYVLNEATDEWHIKRRCDEAVSVRGFDTMDEADVAWQRKLVTEWQHYETGVC